MSHTLELPALREDNPRDFLAALGLLKLLTLLWPQHRPRLSWDSRRMLPRIDLGSALPDTWCADLTKHLQALDSHREKPLRHHKVIKTSYSEFRQAVRQSLTFAERDLPLAALPGSLYAAYSSQIPDDKSHDIAPTAFSFGNGQGGKNLLLDIHQLITALKPNDLADAIAGRAKAVAAKTLRWNPREFRAAAYRGPNPGVKIKGDDILDVPALNILAFIGLTYFPCVHTSRGDRTLGFVSEKTGSSFIWPIWEPPLDDTTMFSLLGQIAADPAPRPGLVRVWKSRRFSSDKSLYFAPPEPVF